MTDNHPVPQPSGRTERPPAPPKGTLRVDPLYDWRGNVPILRSLAENINEDQRNQDRHSASASGYLNRLADRIEQEFGNHRQVQAPAPPHTLTARGFTAMEPVPSEYGGNVRVYESSAAEGPHIWLKATAPVDLNDRNGPQREAPIHLTLDNARVLEQQLHYLISNHYQVRDGD